MPSRTIDWRDLDSGRIQALLDVEIGWWRTHLGWDLSTSWQGIDSARIGGQLSGAIVPGEDGAILGWIFYLRRRGALQIGSVVSADAQTTAALVDHALESPDAHGATIDVSFTRMQAPDLAGVFANHGFALERYRYLSLESPHHVSRSTSHGRIWQAPDLAPAIDLMARAYRDSRELRPFAPDATPDEWSDYVTQLVVSAACGAVLPWASTVAPAADGGGLDGLVLTTAIDDGTAHLAQVVVSPAARQRGLGRRLVTAAIEAVAARGMPRVTLLVAETNVRAAALYASLGFVQVEAFLAAVRRQPRLSTRDEPSTGGASTLR